MKKKVIVSVLACIMVMAAIGIGNAATPPEYLCTISQARAAVWGYSITVKNIDNPSAFTTDRWFVLDQSSPDKARAMYATALSALANSNNVIIYLNSTVEGSTIFTLSVSK